MKRTLIIGVAAALLSLSATAPRAWAFSYMFADGSRPDLICHQLGYDGKGSNIHLDISVGIAPTSPYASDIAIPAQNVIDVWNALEPTTGNLVPGGANNVPNNKLDFESVLLHEMGHALGLGHPNLGAKDGISGGDTDYTESAPGGNGVMNLNSGPDGIIGSADDSRGDDVNLNWFRTIDNDPFSIGPIVDETTYSRDLADLPQGDSYSANPERTVASAIFGLARTESVMQQGTWYDEAQRTLGHDDVAGIRMALSGKDEQAGTSDDYTFTLEYAGITTDADIVITVDSGQTSFAHTLVHGTSLRSSPSHYAITAADIYFGERSDWFFNPIRLGEEPVFGDFDQDGDVDETDFAAFAGFWGTASGGTPLTGDSDDDGDVDAADFSAFSDNWGTAAAPLAGTFTAVPEPSALWLAVLGMLAFPVVRRKRRRAV